MKWRQSRFDVDWNTWTGHGQLFCTASGEVQLCTSTKAVLKELDKNIFTLCIHANPCIPVALPDVIKAWKKFDMHNMFYISNVFYTWITFCLRNMFCTHKLQVDLFYN